MDEDGSRAIILDPTATDPGFSWYQESNGKIWWTMVVGSAGTDAGTGAGT
jgi:hypothetical protein